MNTIFIYDQCGEGPIRFFVLDGDYSHLDGAYVNHFELAETVQEELCGILFNDEGEERHKMSDKFPLAAVQEDTKVVIIGFLP